MQYSSVNGAEYVVGQENIYEDPCDDWLDLINKQITSPNYPVYCVSDVELWSQHFLYLFILYFFSFTEITLSGSGFCSSMPRRKSRIPGWMLDDAQHTGSSGQLVTVKFQSTQSGRANELLARLHST